MIYIIHVAHTAEQDLSSAADYIEFDLFNPGASDELLDEADRKLSSLSEQPERFPLVKDPVLRK